MNILSTSLFFLGAVLIQGLCANANALEPDFQVCPKNGKEKLWAQKRLNADLMNSYIDAHRLRDNSVHIRVYVVDSGFDANQVSNLYHPESFSEEPGVFGQGSKPGDATLDPSANAYQSLVGDPTNDTEGHGTMVVSAIGAKDGIGVAPHTDITLYRVTKDTAGATAGKTDDDFLDYSILHACTVGHNMDPNGLVIINSSWATRASEDGQMTTAKRNPKLVAELANLGCLVVQASGNDAFVAPPSPPALDQGPLLSVGATQAFNAYANFSSSGLIVAPGENVYALASHLTDPSARNNPCEKDDVVSSTPKTFINGTSFSSPMAAGIAAEALGVLRSLHSFAFNALAPQEKIQLLIRILEASSPSSNTLDNIDGLRAVLIAERWTSGVGDVNTLRALLTSSIPANCTTTPNDFDSKRFFLSACQENQKLDDTNKIALELESTALSASAFESAAGFLLTGNADDATIEKFSSAYVASKAFGASADADLNNAIKQLSLRLNMDASFSQFVMPAHLRTNHGQARYLMTALLSSWSTEAYLMRGPGRGSEPILKSLVDNLQQMDLQDVVGTLTDFTHYWFTQLNPQMVLYNANELTTVVRVLNEVRARPAFSSLASTLDSLDEEVLGQMDKQPGGYGKNFDALATNGEEYQERGYIFEFLDRHPNALVNIATDPQLGNYSEVKIEYLAEKTSSARDLPFLARANNNISLAPNWKFNSVTLQQEISALMIPLLAKAAPIEIQTWLNSLDFSTHQTSIVLDTIVEEFSKGLDDFRTIDKTVSQKVSVLQAILNSPQAVNALPSLGAGTYDLKMLALDTDSAPRGLFPKSFLKALKNFH